MPAIDPWEAVGLALFSALVVSAAVSDLRHLRIPNSISVALLCLLAVYRLGSGQVAELGWGLLIGLAFLAGGIVLYATRVWGGGDVKLLAAIAAWVGVDGAVRLLLTTSIAGGLLAMAFLTLRQWRPVDRGMPYGVAISIGGLDWVLSRFMQNF